MSFNATGTDLNSTLGSSSSYYDDSLSDSLSRTSKYSDMERIVVNEFDLDALGPEMGVFFIISILCVNYLLEQVNGKVFRIGYFMTNRHFNLISD